MAIFGFVVLVLIGLYVTIGVSMALYAWALLSNTGIWTVFVSVCVGLVILWFAFAHAPFTITIAATPAYN